MDDELRQQIIEKEKLEGYTDNTLTDPLKLVAKLDQIREQGYGVSSEEREPGAYSIVAPVRDVSGRVVASLCIAGPVYRLDEDVLRINIEAVQDSAARISAKIGFDPT